jgi:hypothetical protein
MEEGKDTILGVYTIGTRKSDVHAAAKEVEDHEQWTRALVTLLITRLITRLTTHLTTHLTVSDRDEKYLVYKH